MAQIARYPDIDQAAADQEYDFVLSEADASGRERDYALSIVRRIDWHLADGRNETPLLGDALADLGDEGNPTLPTFIWWLRAYNAFSRALGTNSDDVSERTYNAIVAGDVELAETECRGA